MNLEDSLHGRFIKARQSSPGISCLELSGGNVLLLSILINVAAAVEPRQLIIEVPSPGHVQQN